MNVAARLDALRRLMAEEGVDAFLVVGDANLRYVTGFEDVFDEGSGALAVIGTDFARVHTDGRYREAAGEAAEGSPWRVETATGRVLSAACDLLEGRRGRVAVEATIAYADFVAISERLSCSVVEAERWVEKLRATKEAGEVERIAAAASLADGAIEHAVALLRPGAIERDVALELEVFLRRSGSEGVAFQPIVASGPNSARPHAIAGRREMERGDLVVVDVGARVGGYCSDLTRTFAIGRAGAREKEMHAAVLAANEAGLAAVRRGVAGSEADAAARELLEARGFGDAFAHGLGHGVGLEVHEAPTLGRSSAEPLPEQAVVTVEPGVYLRCVGGVRIEDLVVVEAGGCRLLSHAPRDLVEVG